KKPSGSLPASALDLSKSSIFNRRQMATAQPRRKPADPANWCPNNVQIRDRTDYPREFLDLRTFYAGPQSLFVAPTMMFIAAMRRCGTAHAFFNIQIMRRMIP
ncbi:MAG: hypothetical protein WAN52_02000, partial [Pseudolabrys sp.]